MVYKSKKITPIDMSGDPKLLAVSVSDLAQLVEDELGQVASAMQGDNAAKVKFVAPPKPRTALQQYADGTSWNPGNGEGFYFQNSVGLWVPMFTTALPAGVVRADIVQAFSATQQAQARSNIGVHYPAQGRLTLVSGLPVMTSTQSAKTTLFWAPRNGDHIPLYDGTNMVPTQFAELSALTTDTTKSPGAIGASKMNDWFVWNDASTLRLGHGPDWTSDTTRSAGTALVSVLGIPLNSVAITNGPGASRGTYVGTTRSNASSQIDWILGGAASGGVAGFLGIWNMYERVSIGCSSVDNGAAYTYNSGTPRQARASAGMQHSFVVGIQEDSIWASYENQSTTAAVVFAFVASGLQLDATNSFSVSVQGTAPLAQNTQIGQSSSRQFSPGIGLHFVAAVEAADTNVETFNVVGRNTLSFLGRM